MHPTHSPIAVLVLALSSIAAPAAAMCPTGFLEVSSLGVSYGCIQEVEEAPVGTQWIDAVLLCSNEHNGRLPTVQEWLIARDVAPLVDTTLSLEWHGDLTSQNGAMAARVNSSGQTIFDAREITSGAVETRCWIPSQGLFYLATTTAGGGCALGLGALVIALLGGFGAKGWRSASD